MKKNYNLSFIKGFYECSYLHSVGYGNKKRIDIKYIDNKFIYLMIHSSIIEHCIIEREFNNRIVYFKNGGYSFEWGSPNNTSVMWIVYDKFQKLKSNRNKIMKKYFPFIQL
jgi:hypothetical protein